LEHHNSEKFAIKVVKRAILAYSLIIFSLATDYICHNRKWETYFVIANTISTLSVNM